MATIHSEILALKFSKLTKDGTHTAILDDEIKMAMVAVIEEFLDQAGQVGIIAEFVDLGD